MAIVQGVGYPHPEPLALPLHGHLGIRPASRRDGHRLAGPLPGQRAGGEPEPAQGRQHRPHPAQGILRPAHQLVPAVENLAAFRFLAGGKAPSEAERLSSAFQRITGVSADIDELGRVPISRWCR